jgi:26S proteasome regulatory subunit N5
VTLRLRFNQHNIRIIHKYYSKISTVRLAELLQLDAVETENVLRDMVTYMGLGAKINRPEGYVRFFKNEGSALNNWGSDIYELLQKMENASHLIHRERLLK